jgi:hypothetical protein
MDIRNMDNLDWRFSTGSWASGGWFGTQGNSVSFNVWPLAEPKDCKAEELGGAGSDCHDAQVVSKDGAFEGNGSVAEKVSQNIVQLDLDPHQTSSSSIPWSVHQQTFLRLSQRNLTARIQTSVITATNLSFPVWASTFKTTNSV